MRLSRAAGAAAGALTMKMLGTRPGGEVVVQVLACPRPSPKCWVVVWGWGAGWGEGGLRFGKGCLGLAGVVA